MSANPEDALLGRIALHYKLATQAQIDAALMVQRNEKPRARLGEILASHNVLSAEQLQWLLNAQVQYLAKQKAAAGPSAVAAPAPAPAVAAPAVAAVAAPAPSRPAAPARAPTVPAAQPGGGSALEKILQSAVQAKASDVHIHSGAPVQFRVNGVLKEFKTAPLDAEGTRALLAAVLTPEQQTQLFETNDLDLALQLPCGRFRVSMYKQQRGFDAVFRPISATPPTLEQLGLPPAMKRLTEFHQGLVLVTGPAGCGKSSTLAALVNMVNESRHDHIITVEDPIEYVHTGKGCIINQRQAGKHTLSFANALRAALREDPDVIVIGELRDLETMSLAITAAETGHLVMGTLHTNNAIRTINRILDAFPPKQQSQIRAMVSESLRAIVSQRLLPSADGTRRVAATEMLFVKPAVSNLIRDQKTFQIRSIMQTGRSEGMSLLDDSLFDMVKAKTITLEVARRVCEDPKRFAPGAA